MKLKFGLTKVVLVYIALILIASVSVSSVEDKQLYGYNGSEWVPLKTDAEGVLKMDVDLREHDSDIIPATDSTYNIGTTLLRWWNGFFNNLTVTDTVTAGAFVGDGSGLTGISGTGGQWSIAGSDYMINNSGILDINGTLLNATIDDRFGNQSAIWARIASDQEIETATATKILFRDDQTGSFDVLGEWNNTNNRFIAKEAGKYLITTNIRANQIGDNIELRVNILLNGVSMAEGRGLGGAGSHVQVTDTTIAQLVVGDEIKVTAAQNSGANVSLDAARSGTYIAIIKLNPGNAVSGGADGIWTNVSGTATYYGDANVTGTYYGDGSGLTGLDNASLNYAYNGSEWKGWKATPEGILQMEITAQDVSTASGDLTVNGDLTVTGDGNFGGTVYADNFSSNSPLRLQTGGTTRLFINDTTGYVGIGTSSPAYKSHILSSGTATIPFYVQSSSGDGAAFIYDSGVNQPAFGLLNSSGDLNVYIRPDGNSYILGGNVGIGTDSPGDPLHIKAPTGYGASVNDPIVRIESDEGKHAILEFRGNGSGTEYFIGRRDQAGDDKFTIGRAGIAFDFHIDNSGNAEFVNNVGIGTSSPEAKLQVHQTPTATGFDAPITWFSGGWLDNSVYSIGFGYRVSQTNPPAQIGYIPTDSGVATAGDLVFGTRSVNTDTAVTERMRIDKDGNVGIGTDSPSAGLHAAEGTFAAPVTSGSEQDVFLRINDPTVSGLTLDFGLNVAGGAYSWLQSTDKNDHSLKFPLVLNPNGGNVGIGTTSPQYGFDVRETAGTWTAAMINSNATGGHGLVILAGDSASEYILLLRDYQAISKFEFYADGDAKCAGGGDCWGQISDIAYKSNIVDLEYGLNEVMQLQPRRYDFELTGESDIGLVAQEAELIIPELVSSEEGNKSIGMSGFIPILINAIQELKSENDELKQLVCLDHPEADICGEVI